jgi:serine/threonine protein phosphatase PrpC
MTEPSAAQPDTGTIRVRIFGRTDVGRVREHNEDNFVVADLTRRSRSLREEDREQEVGPNGLLMAFCDGMGGAAASRRSTTTIWHVAWSAPWKRRD